MPIIGTSVGALSGITHTIVPSSKKLMLAKRVTRSSPVLGTPALKQKQVLISTALASGHPTLDNPFALKRIQAAALSNSAPTISAGTYRRTLLTTDRTSGAPVLASPALVQKQVISASALSGGHPSLTVTAPGRNWAAALSGGAPSLATPTIHGTF